MEKEDLKKLFGEGKVALYNNPFEVDSIQGIHFHYRRMDIFGDIVNDFYATIEFKNGDTSGEQKIKASTFQELYQKVVDFCDSL